MKKLLWLLLLLGMCGDATAQTVNPSRIAWDYAPAEHAQVSRYQLGYWLTGAAEPFTTAEIVKAAVLPEDADSWITAMPRPVLGTFTARLKACQPVAGGGEVCSDWSNATDPFALSPPAIVGVRLVP